MNKIAVVSSYLGGLRDGIYQYQPDRTLEERFKLASQVQGLAGLELRHPADFGDLRLLRSLIASYGLGVPAINFASWRNGKWWRGSFAAESAAERNDLIDEMKRVIDLAAELGCMRLTACPMNDGHDYPFEMDYTRAYGAAQETFARICAHNPDVRIGIEYRWRSPRAHALVGNAGETLSFCQSVGAANLGVTVDFGHSLQAGERPAQVACMLARAGKLFYVHLNDNDRGWDWDMLPGSHNLWDLVEFFYYLGEVGYDGDWYACDVTSKELDTVATFNAVVSLVRKVESITARIDKTTMAGMLARRDPVQSMSYLYSLL